MNFEISKQDSLAMKGIAICAMLWHHLFYTHSEYGRFVQELGYLGKVCVAMFLFVSGYGLYKSFNKLNFSELNFVSGGVKTIKFICKRLTKFYLNYWVVFLIFVPIGVFVFDIGLEQRYGQNITLGLVKDWFGINGWNAYNITWWFNNLIIILYLVFPLLFIAVKKGGWIAWVISLFVMRFCGHLPEWVPNEMGQLDWQFPFVCGMVWCRYENLLTEKSKNINIVVWQIVAVIMLILCVCCRVFYIIPHFGGTRIDAFIAIFTMMFIITCINQLPIISSVFSFVGKHATNMYLTHTFIFAYWFKDFIYSFKYPIFIFIALFLITLGISYILEFIKDKLGVYKLMSIF